VTGTTAWIDLDEDAFALGTGSTSAVKVLHTRPGIDFRQKVTFEGDGRNLAASTSWMYFRIAGARTRADAALIATLR
jgi:hypothetical protein